MHSFSSSAHTTHVAFSDIMWNNHKTSSQRVQITNKTPTNFEAENSSTNTMNAASTQVSTPSSESTNSASVTQPNTMPPVATGPAQMTHYQQFSQLSGGASGSIGSTTNSDSTHIHVFSSDTAKLQASVYLPCESADIISALKYDDDNVLVCLGGEAGSKMFKVNEKHYDFLLIRPWAGDHANITLKPNRRSRTFTFTNTINNSSRNDNTNVREFLLQLSRSETSTSSSDGRFSFERWKEYKIHVKTLKKTDVKCSMQTFVEHLVLHSDRGVSGAVLAVSFLATLAGIVPPHIAFSAGRLPARLSQRAHRTNLTLGVSAPGSQAATPASYRQRYREAVPFPVTSYPSGIIVMLANGLTVKVHVRKITRIRLIDPYVVPRTASGSSPTNTTAPSKQEANWSAINHPLIVIEGEFSATATSPHRHHAMKFGITYDYWCVDMWPAILDAASFPGGKEYRIPRAVLLKKRKDASQQQQPQQKAQRPQRQDENTARSTFSGDPEVPEERDLVTHMRYGSALKASLQRVSCEHHVTYEKLLDSHHAGATDTVVSPDEIGLRTRFDMYFKADAIKKRPLPTAQDDEFTAAAMKESNATNIHPTMSEYTAKVPPPPKNLFPEDPTHQQREKQVAYGKTPQAEFIEWFTAWVSALMNRDRSEEYEDWSPQQSPPQQVNMLETTNPFMEFLWMQLFERFDHMGSYFVRERRHHVGGYGSGAGSGAGGDLPTLVSSTFGTFGAAQNHLDQLTKVAFQHRLDNYDHYAVECWVPLQEWESVKPCRPQFLANVDELLAEIDDAADQPNFERQILVCVYGHGQRGNTTFGSRTASKSHGRRQLGCNCGHQSCEVYCRIVNLLWKEESATCSCDHTATMQRCGSLNRSFSSELIKNNRWSPVQPWAETLIRLAKYDKHHVLRALVEHEIPQAIRIAVVNAAIEGHSWKLIHHLIYNGSHEAVNTLRILTNETINVNAMTRGDVTAERADALRDSPLEAQYWSDEYHFTAAAKMGAEEDLFPGENTPLHLAAAFGNTELVTCLLDMGAAFDVTNSNGLTPYEVAKAPHICDVIDTWVNANTDQWGAAY